MRWMLVWMFLALPAQAEQNVAGEFDYYVMALSWSPNWCAREGDARGSDQCDARHDYGWILHGLWPQYHRGYPEFCQTIARPPTRRMASEMTDIMGSAGLAWHQWRKHGSCSGLDAPAYFDLSRKAYETIVRPEVFRRLEKTVKLPAKVVEEAFLKENPLLEPDMITITCRDSHIQETRICLSKNLKPVPCGQDVVRDCTQQDALFAPIR
ncbi:ribonuclease T2 [uncultured Roseobacter sp.]|uniref:ribonuclease T2 n=1 Tax=uncultured Roseobacter sp. TaxID=114847 RepID=UPI00260AF4EA|nr:ribonuclease T2 [uncultured Roseobacter sp.]